MKVIVDRIEGEYLVVEITNGNFVNIPRILVPNAKENDVISINIDYNETEKRKKEIQTLMNNVFED